MSLFKVCVNYLASCSSCTPSYVKLSITILSLLFFGFRLLSLIVKKSATFERLGIQSLIYDKLITKSTEHIFQDAVEYYFYCSEMLRRLHILLQRVLVGWFSTSAAQGKLTHIVLHRILTYEYSLQLATDTAGLQSLIMFWFIFQLLAELEISTILLMVVILSLHLFRFCIK